MTKKYLITSALPYVNAVPHLGNLIGSTLSADVYARFCRMMGRETLYVCGSDEHGTATETKAKELGVSPKALCDEFYAKHKSIYEWFGISFDIFGRTSAQEQHAIVTELFNKVLEHGFIEEKTIVQPYSEKSQSFLADRFVVGTCPHCDYEDARGDQCDKCGKLLDPQELINPKSAVDGTTPIFKETDHLFLRLDKLQGMLEPWFEKHAKQWSSNAIAITKNWLKEGLQPRAITRDLDWGVSVPESAFEGRYKDKVFYVWFDAPIGYMSITAQATKDWKQWWQPQDTKDVELYQFMGKDNVPFHSIIFPATLMAAQDTPGQYTTVHHLSATEYLNYEGGKFSKSRGVGVFGDNAQESGIPADVFRYVLLYNRPEGGDTQFTWKGLQERLNNELVANLGNFVNRTLSFTQRFFDGKLTTAHTTDVAAQKFITEYKNMIGEYIAFLDAVKLRDALIQLMKISSLANTYFQASEPWKTRNNNPEQAQADLTLLVNVAADLAFLMQPYMPHVAASICKQIGIDMIAYESLGEFTLKDHTIAGPEILFKKLEDKDIEELQAKYGGVSKEQQTTKDDSSKKNKNKSNNKKKEKKSAPVTPLKPSDVVFKVGKITSIKKHEKADKLFVEQVDMGNGITKQIVSGLVDYYKAEELEGKHIIVVDNLLPAKLRGEKSEGMVLAAENNEGTVGLVFAPESKPGETLTANSVQDSELEAKESITFEEFMTLELEAKAGNVYINKEPVFLSDSKGLVIDRVQDGNIR
jgi:methionyl-tRNA synthetase